MIQLIRQLKYFTINCWKFRKILWNHRSYDYIFTLQTLRTSLEILYSGMETSYEEKESLTKKLNQIKRAITLLQNIEDDNYVDRVELELGKKYVSNIKIKPKHILINDVDPLQDEINRLIFDRSIELQEKEWTELFQILKGQDNSEIENWDCDFDGSGMRSWWN
jgi:hypothetical protein